MIRNAKIKNTQIRILKKYEKKIMEIYNLLQEPINRYCNEYKDDGRSLGYNYIIGKIAGILKYTDLRDKCDRYIVENYRPEEIRLHDLIWEKVCKETIYKFEPSNFK